MKTITLQPANLINETELENLLQEVREMVRFEKLTSRPAKLFTSAQLSRIQNSKRPVVVRKGFKV